MAELSPGEAIEVLNPVNKDTPYLRTSLLPGLLDVVIRNRNQSIRDVRVFEVGKTFGLEGGGQEERWKVGGALSGSRYRPSWAAEAAPLDYYDGKGILWGLMEALEVDSPVASCYDWPFLSSDAGAGLAVNGCPVGAFGMLSREALKIWGMDAPVFAFELDLKELAGACVGAREFSPLPRYPTVRRDVALVLPEEVQTGAVIGEINGVGEELLSDAEVFDVYRGEQLGDGRKSLAFSLTYMSRDRTLTDAEVDAAHGRIVDTLLRAFGASLRE
jgi:phenylalanyl-tRNA synthetase beta chain